MIDSIKNSQMKKPLIAGILAGFFAVALFIANFSVNASTQDGGVVVEDSDVILQIGNAYSSDKAKSMSKVQVIGNYRTVSAAKVKQAKDKNRCKTISGAKAIQLGVMTQGYNGSGVGYAAENRTTTMCDTDNDGKYDTRAECGNRLKVTNQSRPNEAKATVWVDNFSNAKAKLTAKVKVKATAKCETEFASASATARARASAEAFVQVKTLTGANGKVKGSEVAKIKANALAKATAEAKAKAVAQVKASANCKSEVVIIPGHPTPCKDNPKTPEDECHPCKDNPKTPEDECHPTPPQCEDCEPGNTTTVTNDDDVSTSSTSYGSSDVTTLPDTGPGAIAAVFSVVTAAGTLGYSAFLRRFSQG